MVHQLRNYTLHLFCAIIAFTLCPHIAEATDAEPGKQVQQSTTIVTDGEKSSIPHWTYLPKSYSNDTKQAVPLLLFLHGAGESGDNLKQVLQWGPPKRIVEGKHYPLVIVSPQCPDRKIGWNGKQLHRLEHGRCRYVQNNGNSTTFASYGCTNLRPREYRKCP